MTLTDNLKSVLTNRTAFGNYGRNHNAGTRRRPMAAHFSGAERKLTDAVFAQIQGTGIELLGGTALASV